MRFGNFRSKTWDEWREGVWWAWYPVRAYVPGTQCWQWVWREYVRYQACAFVDLRYWEYELLPQPSTTAKVGASV
jgi:hypothetical protein